MKHPITAFTPALAGVRISDATSADALAFTMISIPEESPAIHLVLHLARRIGRRARVCRAGAVGSAMRAIVLVICLKDGEGLLG